MRHVDNIRMYGVMAFACLAGPASVVFVFHLLGEPDMPFKTIGLALITTALMMLLFIVVWMWVDWLCAALWRGSAKLFSRWRSSPQPAPSS